jgi:acyl-homoserine-lactone acylase
MVVFSCAPSALAHAAKPRVTVTRDSAGIPHIVAKDFRSLGYGEGYAYAQDNLCLFADAVITLRAQRSKYFGPDALAFQYVARRADPNWKSDLWWRRVRDSRIVEKGVAQKPPLGPSNRVRALYEGWAAGYNAYLNSGKLRDPRCKGKPWVKPITPMDLNYRGTQLATTPSSSLFITGLVDAAPPTGAAMRARQSLRPDLSKLSQDFNAPSAPSQSNGAAFGSKATSAGGGMVFANPHAPWRGTERWWMVHLKIPGVYDVMGGTLSGYPPIGIGFNKYLAWTHTTSTARRFVLFQLKLKPGDPTSYLVDGQAEKMRRQTVTAGGRTHTFYLTRYGPVMNLREGNLTWTGSTAYALADVEANNFRGANQYLAMGQAKSVNELLQVERRYLAIPAFYTIAADRKGRALFTDTGAIPNVPQAKLDACLPNGLPRAVFTASRVITLDGSRSECALEKDPGAIVPNVFAPSRLPKLVRRDYFENSNDSYWLANARRPLTGFPNILGLERTPLMQRTRQGHLMILSRLGKFSVRSLQRMWENDRNYSAELTAKPLAAACSASPRLMVDDGSTVDISEACPVLDAYGDSPTGNLDDPGAWLFNEWIRRAPPFTGALFSDPFDPSRPLDTPRVLNTGNPDVLQALGAAVKSMRDNGVKLNATLRQTQYAPQSKAIPIHGCWQCFQRVDAANGTPVSVPGPNGILESGPYGQVNNGANMVLTIELRKNGPRAEGILAPSQATDRTSPWYTNMTRLFSKKRWVRLRFTARELASDGRARQTRLP